MNPTLSVTLSEAKSLRLLEELGAFGSEVLRDPQDDNLRK